MELILLSSVSIGKHSAQGVDVYTRQTGKDHTPSGKIHMVSFSNKCTKGRVEN